MKTRYAALAQVLVQAIRSGQWPVGSLLPGEVELAQQHGVSRATVRAALDHLEELGLVSRHRGLGTRVEAVRAGTHFRQTVTPIDDIMQFAGDARRAVERIEDVVADEALAARLDGRPGRHWLHIAQRRLEPATDLAVCWTDVYVDSAYADIRRVVRRYPGLVCDLIEERFGVCVEEIRQEIRAVGVPAAVAAHLGVEPGARGLELTRRYLDPQERVIEIAISVLPADRFTYTVRLRRSPGPGAASPAASGGGGDGDPPP
ncbi:GntR family transcriptional regulator [Azospirillum sp. ST 5-10]|uniref:GntR family transcriptional regulator n=1 Tax=unclassified Azospirillum TaxID=2630922 RepID=UPI003F4A6A80